MSRAAHRAGRRLARGFALVPVVLVLGLLAVASVLLGQTGGLGTHMAGGRIEAEQARYAAEAAVAHARWQLSRQAGCGGYNNLATTAFDGGSYSATINPKNNSPVRVRATATTAAGATVGVERMLPKLDPVYTATLQPGAAGEDTWLEAAQPARNHGAAQELKVATNGTNSLLRFDLRQIPIGSRVVAATLWLHQRTVPASTGGSLAVHRMKRSWTEGSAAVPADPANGATWNGPAPGLAWATPGGDFEAQAATTRPYEATPGWKTWDLTTLAAGWVAGVFPNYGLVLRGTGDVQNVEFRGNDEPVDAYARPKLVINYAAPCGSAPPTLVAGLVAWWRMDDGGGNNVLDEVGAHTGARSGATWTTGKKGGALQFDGINDYVLVSHADDLSLASGLTLAAWVRPGALSGYQVVLSKGSSGTNRNYRLATNNREINFAYYNNGLQEFQTSGLNLQTGTWYHLAASYDAATNTVRIYLDGTLVYSANAPRSLVANAESLLIARDQSGNRWDGRLDDVRIYNVALSPPEVGVVAGQTTLAVTADALLDGRPGFRDHNYGNYNPLRVNGQDPARTALRFDTGQIGIAAIASASLQVYVKQVANPSGAAVPVPVHALTESWTEGTRAGSTPANGVTWNRRDGTVAWLTPGGSLAATPAGTLSVPAGIGQGFVEADITALVRDWATGITANNGVALLHGGASPGNDLLDLESRSVTTNAARIKVFYE